MTILNVRTTEKSFNEIPYTEFILYVQDNKFKRMIRTTGKTPVVYVDENGVILDDETRLDKVMLKNGDQISVWFDVSGKVSQIDVILNNFDS